MIIEEKVIKIKGNKELVLRSPMPEDAKAILEHMIRTSEETYFMARYPEEITRTVEEQAQMLKKICEDKDSFMIAAFDNGKLIANASVQKIRDHIKCRHRGGFGISILKKYCDSGLGTSIMKEIIANVQKTDFDQIELGVFEDNVRAIHLYKKMGFVVWGTQPRAFKLKDGTYRDEIQMIYDLMEERHE